MSVTITDRATAKALIKGHNIAKGSKYIKPQRLMSFFDAPPKNNRKKTTGRKRIARLFIAQPKKP